MTADTFPPQHKARGSPTKQNFAYYADAPATPMWARRCAIHAEEVQRTGALFGLQPAFHVLLDGDADGRGVGGQ